jgi:hypothetical protein
MPPSVGKAGANLRSLGDSRSGANETDGGLRGVAKCIYVRIVRGKRKSGNPKPGGNLRERVIEIFESQPARNRIGIGCCHRGIENVEIEVHVDAVHVLSDFLEDWR